MQPIVSETTYNKKRVFFWESLPMLYAFISVASSHSEKLSTVAFERKDDTDSLLRRGTVKDETFHHLDPEKVVPIMRFYLSNKIQLRLPYTQCV